MALNNNQVATVVNSAFEQTTGQTGVVQLDLSNVVDVGNDPNVVKEKESFTEALCAALMKNWFTDSSYRSQYSDPFFEDAEEYGAIIQNIAIEVPEVQQSHAWKDFRPVGGVPATAGVYDLYLPVVHTQYYGKSVSWEIPVCVTDEQWDPAFRSASELKTFVNYIMMCVDNALVQHLQNMNDTNRNNFIGEKAAYAATPGATGIHIVNLVEAYQESQETPANMTVEQYLNSTDGLQFATECISNYIGYMGRMSSLFNTAGRNRFTPKDRLVVQILSQFENRLNRVARSDVFNKELVSLPGHDVVPYWQGSGTGLTFAEVANINVKTSTGSSQDIDGVVAFVADKWACMHTVKDRDVVAQQFKPEHLTQYYHQFRDQYMNDLTMNALVFVVQDYTA